MGLGIKEKMARRAAAELRHGDIVNLGIGLPTLVADFIDPEKQVILHSENGFLGMGGTPTKGKEDPNLINAGGFPVTLDRGGCYFDSLTSFAIIRGGKLDVTILGALQVSARGDLANWIVPGQRVPGMGGGMDLALKAKKTIVLTTHCAKDGSPKIVEECTLPLTAAGCVKLIITDLAVLEVTPEGLLLLEMDESVTLEELREKTGATFQLPSQRT
jgi:acetate CoA/acetoacetate CoA-transferase beta subunit